MSETIDLSISLAENSDAPAETVKVTVTYEDPRNAISALAQIARREHLTQLWNGLVSDQWEDVEGNEP
ncbi:hypothetical protein GS907_24445 [Rhodococcus hoagii]|nr:hypothetical protein [Prescottella equi]